MYRIKKRECGACFIRSIVKITECNLVIHENSGFFDKFAHRFLMATHEKLHSGGDCFIRFTQLLRLTARIARTDIKLYPIEWDSERFFEKYLRDVAKLPQTGDMAELIQDNLKILHKMNVNLRLHLLCQIKKSETKHAERAIQDRAGEKNV